MLGLQPFQPFGPMKIYNHRNEEVILNAQEKHVAEYWSRAIKNSLGLGYNIDITALTTIMKSITDQTFYEIPPADYLPLRVGEGAWADFLTTYRSFNMSGDFEEGVVNLAGDNTRLSSADAGVDALNIAVFSWAKIIGWSVMQLMTAAKAGNWDLVTAKEESRKKNWDLGIQKIAFLGMNSNSACKGLLNQSGITTNTTIITKPISSMTTAELKTFSSQVINAYRNNCNRTAWPTHFIIPESDFDGLVSQASADFPVKTVLELLEESFKLGTRNKNFKVLPLAYGDMQYSGFSQQVYVLLNYNEKSIRMDIPVDYTNTLANSLDNFMFQNVGYGQFTGVLAYRPLELLYFKYTPA